MSSFSFCVQDLEALPKSHEGRQLDKELLPLLVGWLGFGFMVKSKRKEEVVK